MLVPTPRNAHAEGRDARSGPKEEPSRGSGEKRSLPVHGKIERARARSLSGEGNQGRNQVVGSVAWDSRAGQLLSWTVTPVSAALTTVMAAVTPVGTDRELSPSSAFRFRRSDLSR